MKKNILFLTLFLALIFTACKKDGETIINNNYTNDGKIDPPKRKMMTEYGDKDENYVLKCSYYNDEIGKLKEMTTYSAGVAGEKIVVLYNSNGNPIGYQVYSLPANTLDGQGTYILDNENRIVKVVNREVNADTNSIVTLKYTGLDYQPGSIVYYDKAQNQITNYSYFNYDAKGNLYSQTDYQFDGIKYNKIAVVTTSNFSNAINPLNQLYYYLVRNSPNTTSSQYFSNYFGESSRTDKYNADGTSNGANLYDYSVETDADNYVTKIFTDGQEIIIKYE